MKPPVKLVVIYVRADREVWRRRESNKLKPRPPCPTTVKGVWGATAGIAPQHGIFVSEGPRRESRRKETPGEKANETSKKQCSFSSKNTLGEQKSASAFEFLREPAEVPGGLTKESRARESLKLVRSGGGHQAFGKKGTTCLRGNYGGRKGDGSGPELTPSRLEIPSKSRLGGEGGQAVIKVLGEVKRVRVSD